MNTNQIAPVRPDIRARPLWTMNMGVRSAIAVCKGRKTSLVAPGTGQDWLPEVRDGSRIRLKFTDRRPGWADIEVTACCFHEQIAQIPGCAKRHDASAIDPEGVWGQILSRALCGGNDPVAPEVMEGRAAKGWYVLDFTVVRRHAGWCAARGIAEPTAA